jgi:hypothetical protein
MMIASEDTNGMTDDIYGGLLEYREDKDGQLQLLDIWKPAYTLNLALFT